MSFPRYISLVQREDESEARDPEECEHEHEHEYTSAHICDIEDHHEEGHDEGNHEESESEQQRAAASAHHTPVNDRDWNEFPYTSHRFHIHVAHTFHTKFRASLWCYLGPCLRFFHFLCYHNVLTLLLNYGMLVSTTTMMWSTLMQVDGHMNMKLGFPSHPNTMDILWMCMLLVFLAMYGYEQMYMTRYLTSHLSMCWKQATHPHATQPVDLLCIPRLLRYMYPKPIHNITCFYQWYWNQRNKIQGNNTIHQHVSTHLSLAIHKGTHLPPTVASIVTQYLDETPLQQERPHWTAPVSWHACSHGSTFWTWFARQYGLFQCIAIPWVIYACLQLFALSSISPYMLILTLIETVPCAVFIVYVGIIAIRVIGAIPVPNAMDCDLMPSVDSV